MVKKSRNGPRREESLSREQIVSAAVALLDEAGENGLTFRALSERLATGPGAIYWHVTDKSDLLTAACDAVVAATLATPPTGRNARRALCELALGLFDALDVHPWVGSALMRAPGQLPMVRILERIGQQVRALSVPRNREWKAVSALLSYILGVSGQNAANTQFARVQGLDRDTFLDTVAATWSQLDGAEFPFTKSVARDMAGHDDRADYLAGIELILDGLQAAPGR